MAESKGSNGKNLDLDQDYEWKVEVIRKGSTIVTDYQVCVNEEWAKDWAKRWREDFPASLYTIEILKRPRVVPPAWTKTEEIG